MAPPAAITSWSRVYCFICSKPMEKLGRHPHGVRAVSSHLDDRDSIDPAAGEDDLSVRRRCHVAHDAAAVGNWPGPECFVTRIEADQRVRIDAGLAVPNDVVTDSDAVGTGIRAARRGPVARIAGPRI